MRLIMLTLLAVLCLIIGANLAAYTVRGLDVCDTPARYDAMSKGVDCANP